MYGFVPNMYMEYKNKLTTCLILKMYQRPKSIRFYVWVFTEGVHRKRNLNSVVSGTSDVPATKYNTILCVSFTEGVQRIHKQKWGSNQVLVSYAVCSPQQLSVSRMHLSLYFDICATCITVSE